jgi:HEAT repeats
MTGVPGVPRVPGVLGAAVIVGAVLVAAPAGAQTLEQRIQGSAVRGAVTWVGYRLPMIGGPRHMCCYDSMSSAGAGAGMCRLEGSSGISMTTGSLQSRGNRIVLEAPTDFVVLTRVENGSITRVRTFTPDCDLDATGATLVWLQDVKPDDSVTFLSALVSRVTTDRDATRRISNQALTALAVQAGDRATAALVGFAKTHANTHVRGQALFWLAQRAGQQAVTTIGDAIDNDPETEVKKRAVFALSQLPKDEGVPKLIDVARNHRNPEVRKQAFFWLGQSKDPRAVQLFEEILLRK